MLCWKWFDWSDCWSLSKLRCDFGCCWVRSSFLRKFLSPKFFGVISISKWLQLVQSFQVSNMLPCGQESIVIFTSQLVRYYEYIYVGTFNMADILLVSNMTCSVVFQIIISLNQFIHHLSLFNTLINLH